jgi:hypothetical protein
MRAFSLGQRMTIPICQVSVTLVAPDGGALSGVKITARLTAPIAYQGLIVPIPYSKTTNQAGQCVLSLWPNSLGEVTTTYTFEVLMPGQSIPLYFHDVTVPNVASVTLQELLGIGGGATVVFYVETGYVADDYVTTEQTTTTTTPYMATDYVAADYVAA